MLYSWALSWMELKPASSSHILIWVAGPSHGSNLWSLAHVPLLSLFFQDNHLSSKISHIWAHLNCGRNVSALSHLLSCYCLSPVRSILTEMIGITVHSSVLDWICDIFITIICQTFKFVSQNTSKSQSFPRCHKLLPILKYWKLSMTCFLFYK